MPPVRRVPGGVKSGTSDAKETPTAETEKPKPEPTQPEHPWSSPSEVVDEQGLSMMLFSHPGIGKTTSALSMLSSKDEGDLLVINFDEELRSISDLGPDSRVSVWPGKKQNGRISSWQQIETFTSRLLTAKNLPFAYLLFDTLNSAYDKFAYPWVEQQNPGSRDPRQLFGKANDLILSLVTNFCAVAREKGLNVVFTCHAEEKQIGENGPIIVRPKITPGVVLGINQRVSLIGYLHPPVGATPRKLQLAPSNRVTAKIHQPRTGPQVPGMIPNPDLGKLINHLKFGIPYPVKDKDA